MHKGLFFSIILMLLVACAQQGQPLTGGPKDTIPPVLKKSIPIVNDTGYTKKKIIVKFNEFIQLDNINDQFFISPPLTTKPKFKIAGKKVIVKFKEKLKDSITYTLDFGNAIVDNNEKNKLENFEFIFSTYSEKDSLQLSGKIIDAYTYLPAANISVGLYSIDEDSIPLKQAPVYVAKTDSTGFFRIKNIKKKPYKIFALLDMNNNFIFDKDENQIAYRDTLFAPYAERALRYDTIDSGSVITRFVNDSLIHDTLMSDSVSITEITKFYPDNIELLLFTEQSDIQEIKRKKRTTKGGAKLFFTKQLFNNYLEVLPLQGTDKNKFENIVEIFPSKDSAYIWFKNKEFYDKDSLNFRISYFLDSSNQTIDTLKFSAYDFATDTLPIEINRQNENISTFDYFSFVTQTPVQQIDTQKIHLYQKVDTVVIDTKMQKVNAFRPANDSLVFIFKRPVTNNINIRFENIKTDYSLLDFSTNSTRDTVTCSIKNTELSALDTLHLKLFYDNQYFYNILKEHEQDFKLPVSPQKAISIKRPSQDTVIVLFQKNLTNQFKIKSLQFNDNDFSFFANKNKLTINILSPEVIKKDTLDFYFEDLDMEMLDGTNKFYKDTLNAIFIFDRQRISFYQRYFRSKLVLAFKKSFLETPELELLSFNPLGKWYTLAINQKRDTIHVNIKNESVKRLNTMILAVKYFDINQHNDTVNFVDTLKLKVEKSENKNSETIGQGTKLQLDKPVPIKISQDSIFIRKYYVETVYKPGTNYSFQIDSAGITDVFDKVSDTTSFDFKVFTPEEFAMLSISIKNIQKALDSLAVIDTTELFILKKGSLVLVIEDENNNIYKTKKIISDKTISDNRFIAGTYSLKIYYDENNNGKWDNGDYFRHTQSEKVFVFPEKIVLTEDTEQKIIWDLCDY